LEELSAKDVELKQTLSEIKSANKRLDDQMRMMQNEPSAEELAAQLKQYGKQVDTLNARLARIKGDGKQVDKSSMQRVQKAFNDACTTWVKRKRAAEDMMGDMAGEDGTVKEVAVSIHIFTRQTGY
jgi:prefoldin subunit 5